MIYATYIPDDIKEFHSLHIFNQEVDVVIILQGSYEEHDERKLYVLEYPFFLKEMFFKGLFYNLVLLDAFEGVQLFILFVLDEVDGTELTETEFLDHNHIFELQEIIIILLGIGGLHILNFM